MANSKEILSTPCTLKVNNVEYVDKVTHEKKTFNKYVLEVDGRDFDINLAPADKKLFEYIIGL